MWMAVRMLNLDSTYENQGGVMNMKSHIKLHGSVTDWEMLGWMNIGKDDSWVGKNIPFHYFNAPVEIGIDFNDVDRTKNRPSILPGLNILPGENSFLDYLGITIKKRKSNPNPMDSSNSSVKVCMRVTLPTPMLNDFVPHIEHEFSIRAIGLHGKVDEAILDENDETITVHHTIPVKGFELKYPKWVST